MELSASFNHDTAMDAETVARSIKAGVTPGLRDLSKKIKADHYDTECE